MKKNTNRDKKIASKVQSIISEIIYTKYHDDELLSKITFTGSESSGLSFVRIFYTTIDNKEQTEKKLKNITNNLRFLLANKINQKYVPEIVFKYDDTQDKLVRLNKIFKEIEQNL